MRVWLEKKLWIPQLIQEQLGCDVPVLFSDHHESHAASAFYPSPYREAAIATLDGVGEWTTTSYGYGRDAEIHTLADIKFPTRWIVLFGVYLFYGLQGQLRRVQADGTGPYGEPKYVDLMLNEIIDLKEDGSFKLNTRYFNYLAGLTMTSRAMDKLFGGPPRRPETPLTQREMDIARSCQVVTEEVMLRIARTVHRETKLKICAWPVAWHSIALATAASCARVPLKTSGSSRPQAMPVGPWALRWRCGITTWATSGWQTAKTTQCRGRY